MSITRWRARRAPVRLHALACAALAFSYVDCSHAQASWIYRRPVIVYVEQDAPSRTRLNWDQACAEVMPLCSGSNPRICYSNPRGGFHPSFGQGCYYTYTEDYGSGRIFTNPDYFRQNAVLVRKACPLPSENWVYLPESDYCAQRITYQRNEVCPDANPVYASDGAKRQSERDFTVQAPSGQIDFTRTAYTNSIKDYRSPFGWGWALDPWGRSIDLSLLNASTSADILVNRGAGQSHALSTNGSGVWTASPYDGIELRRSDTTWTLLDRNNGTEEIYDSTGRLLTLARID